MSEIDPVILELRADLDRYLGQLRSTTTNVDRLLGAQEKRVKQLEAQMKRSSGEIKGAFKEIAASIAAYLSGRELIGIIDNFTRLQNSLKVAGLEGENLAAVQSKLLEIGSRYGVSINELAGLYGKSSQAAKELGASQIQILSLTKETAQALMITGTSSAQAQGAILGLTQALASGTVRAEEFNQINEGGLRPLLQAAAAAGRWGGSVAKLRQDVIAGKVSSQEFFAAVLAGSKQLEGQASKAVLTISGAFTSLSNAITVYIGQAAQSNGATTAIAGGLKLLAENLDLVVNALAVIGIAIGGTYIGNAVMAARASAALSAALVGTAGAMGAAGAASFAMQARMAGAATTMEAMAFAARGAGASLLAAFGGPVGVAVTALALGIAYVATREDEAAHSARVLAEANAAADAKTEGLRKATEELATATGKARDSALANAMAKREETLQYIANTKAALENAKAQLAAARVKYATDSSRANSQARYSTREGAALTADVSLGGVQTAQSRVDFEQAAINRAEKAVNDLDKVISAGSSVPKIGGAGKKGGKGSGPSGPSAAEIEQRYWREMQQLYQEELRAQADLATNAGDRADFEKQMLAAERAERIAQIENDKYFTREQKDAQIAAINRLYGTPAQTDKNGNIIIQARPGLLAQQINLAEARRREDEARQLAEQEYNIKRDSLDTQIDMADTQEDRKRIALEMFDLEERYQQSLLEAVIASEVATDAEKERAKRALAALREMSASRRDAVARGNETDVERYLRGLNKTPQQINEAIDAIKMSGLDQLNDGITQAIMGTKSLGDVFKSVANQIIADLVRIAVQRAIIEPLANSLFGGSGGGGGSLFGSLFGGGGGGGLFNAIGSFFGRASGGYVGPGQMVRVNESASPGNVEAFMSRDGGQIIPLGRMNAIGQGSSAQPGAVAVRIELPEDLDARIQAVSGPVAVEVVRQSAPRIIKASADYTINQAGRPRL